jgi:4-amino-4-deoxy-L-arabinose transferase-like glycosyltransferase
MAATDGTTGDGVRNLLVSHPLSDSQSPVSDQAKLPRPKAMIRGLRRFALSPGGMCVVILLAASAVRMWPLFAAGPAIAAPDYDEGVYVAAARAIAHGATPYRDFVFPHPPAVPLALSHLVTLGSPSFGLGLARVSMALLGGLSACMLSRVVRSQLGLAAGYAAGLTYAIYPAAANSERGVFLEPVLNFLAIASLGLWVLSLGAKRLNGSTQCLLAGLLAGIAITTKLWGALFLLACLMFPPRELRWPRAYLLSGTVLASVALVTPFALAAGPSHLFQQVVSFQLERPPDGEGSALARLGEMLAAEPRPASLLLSAIAVCGALSLAWQPNRLVKIAAAWIGLTAAAFLVSRAYWHQYNAFLAPGLSICVGAAAKWMTTRIGSQRPIRTLSRRLLALLLVLPLSVAAALLLLPPALDGMLPPVAVDNPSLHGVASLGCVWSFEPGWLLVADLDPTMVLEQTIPDLPNAAAAAIDPYAAQLLADQQAGLPRAAEPFTSQASQEPVERLLTACSSGVVVVGGRGHQQLRDAEAQLKHWGYSRLATTSGPDIWVKSPK